MRKYKVLLVEDEPELRDYYGAVLQPLNCEVVPCKNGLEAQQYLQTNNVDVVLTDWILPKLSGLELIQWLRQTKKSTVPVVMITSKIEEADLLVGLEAGADDYLPKPINLKALELRVRNALARIEIQESVGTNRQMLAKGDLVMDLETMEVRQAGQRLELTRYEFLILRAMLENQGKIMSRHKLTALAQGEEVKAIGRAIDTHVFTLRKKLGKDAAEFIESVRGVGYRVKAE